MKEFPTFPDHSTVPLEGRLRTCTEKGIKLNPNGTARLLAVLQELQRPSPITDTDPNLPRLLKRFEEANLSDDKPRGFNYHFSVNLGEPQYLLSPDVGISVSSDQEFVFQLSPEQKVTLTARDLASRALRVLYNVRSAHNAEQISRSLYSAIAVAVGEALESIETSNNVIDLHRTSSSAPERDPSAEQESSPLDLSQSGGTA